MTESMISLAQRNAKEAGVSNVEFIHGTMEAVPLPDNCVDVIISNCVINLAADKDLVLREAYRVLKKGGMFGVSDIVINRQLPEKIMTNMELWTGCLAGALLDKDYLAKLESAGFTGASIETQRVYTKSDVIRLSQ